MIVCQGIPLTLWLLRMNFISVIGEVPRECACLGESHGKLNRGIQSKS